MEGKFDFIWIVFSQENKEKSELRIKGGEDNIN